LKIAAFSGISFASFSNPSRNKDCNFFLNYLSASAASPMYVGALLALGFFSYAN
jgi:hypothetical protein